MGQDKSHPALQIFIKKFEVPEKLQGIIPKILSHDEMIIISYLADKKVTSSEISMRFTDLSETILLSSLKRAISFDKA